MPVDETTPLLPASGNNAESPFPSILSVVQRLPPEPSVSDLVAAYSPSLGVTSPPLADAFNLLLVLHLLVTEKSSDISPSRREGTLKTWHELQRRERSRRNLRLLACELLEHLASTSPASPYRYIEDVLMATFSVDWSKSRMIRVVDLLHHPAVPSEIISHPIITMSLCKLWKYGAAPPDAFESQLSPFQRFLALGDSASAPRTSHGLHLACHLTYLILLAHLILHPSPLPILLEAPGGPTGFREPIITFYSISNILFTPLSFSSLPHILVLISFLFSLPASPSPETTAYLSMLPAFCLHIFYLHFPTYPTPILLVEPAQWLPLSSLYATFFKKCLFPAFLFLLPVILASSVLLSLSLAETLFLKFQTIALSSTPPAARITFLGMFSLSCLLFIFFSASILFLSPSSIHNNDNASQSDWGRYGATVGLQGRRALVRAIIAYSPSPTRRTQNVMFPPPFNVILFPLLPFPQMIRKIAWRFVVAPFAFLIAGLWGWGLT